MPSQEQHDQNQLAVNEWAKAMQGFTQDLGNYMQQTRQENMQAHMINHVHIRKVEQKVDEVEEVVGCLAILVACMVLLFFLIFLATCAR